MGVRRDRLVPVDCHRPKPWNEAAVQRVIDDAGYVLAQVKKDGIRFHAFIDADDAVRIVTREGIEILSLDLQKERLRKLLQALPKAFAVDGEVVVPGVAFEVGSGILRRYEAIPEDELVEFWVWDCMPMAALCGDPCEAPESLSARIDILVGALGCCITPGVDVVPMEPAFAMAELEALYETTVEAGDEGLVAKDPSQMYRNGKVNGAWKMKPSDTCDGRVTGMLWGTPGLGNAGKIIGFTVELEDGVRCDVTGLTQAQMTEFTLKDGMDGGRLWGRYVEIKYMEKTAAGSLRHPSFVCFRDLDYAPGWKS